MIRISEMNRNLVVKFKPKNIHIIYFYYSYVNNFCHVATMMVQQLSIQRQHYLAYLLTINHSHLFNFRNSLLRGSSNLTKTYEGEGRWGSNSSCLELQ